ncbi:CU044_5270 family protein [Spirillospora sp. NPDC050679]
MTTVDELKMVKGMRPHRPEMPAEVETSVRERLHAMAAADAERGVRPARRRSTKMKLCGALAAGAAVTAAVSVVVAEGVGDDDGKPPRTESFGKVIDWPPGAGPMPKDVPSSGPLPGAQLVSAVQLGDRAAEAAESAPYTVPKPTQWVYSRGMQAGGYNMGTWWKGVDVRSRVTTENWMRVDGRAHAQVHKGQLKLYERGVGSTQVSGGPLFHLGNYHTLPTQPDALLRHLYAARYPDQVGATSPQDVFETMSKILQDPSPPKLRAAVYRALPKIKGVTLERGLRDAAGRPGMAFAHVNDYGERFSIILDPNDYRFLGERQDIVRPRRVSLDGGKSVVTKPGTVLLWSASFALKVVDRPGQR